MQVGLRLLPLFKRDGFVKIQIVLAVFSAPRQVQHGLRFCQRGIGGEQIGLGLHQVGRVNLKER